MKIPLVQAFLYPEFIQNHPVWLIASPVSVPGVVHEFAAHVAKRQGFSLRSTSMAEFPALQEQGMQSSLFGGTALYKTSEVSLPLTKAQCTQLEQLKQSAISQRVLVVVAGTKQLPELPAIVIPAHLGKAEAVQIVQALYTDKITQQRIIAALQAIYATQQSLPTGTVFALLMYAQVLGARVQEFLTQRLASLLPVSESLFELSGALLARDRRRFFQLYILIASLYPAQFWIAWWSEQLFKAHGYLVAKQQKDAAQATAIGTRLPFSFLERDYRLVTPPQLHQALLSLYYVDFWLKNGCSDERLDWWYCQWFGATILRLHQ